MTVLSQNSNPTSLFAKFWQQPYLLLSLTTLFWAGNIVLGRFVAGHVPPITLSCLRWAGAFCLMLPFGYVSLQKDWPIIRRNIPMLILLSACGFATNNVLSYWGLQYTQALNGLLLQSSGPLFVALWALILLGIRLGRAQAFGIAISLIGVFTIVLRGDFSALTRIDFNKGDLMVVGALLVFGIYSALMPRFPRINPLSLSLFMTACGSLLLMPLMIVEIAQGNTMKLDAISLGTLAYVMIFPSLLSYLFFNRGLELIGPNRAAPFFHLIPVFGSVMAIVFLGETLKLFHLVGYAMVLAGIIIASRQRSAPTTPMGEPL